MDAPGRKEQQDRSASVTDIVDDLFLSVSEGWTDRVTQLLTEKVARQTFMNLAPTLLHKGASFGHHKVLDLLLSFGSIVDSRNAQHLTPLHVAANEGHSRCVSVLLTYGADVNAKCLEGRTPLYYATYSGDLECVQEIVAYNADVNLGRPGGWTPLHDACRFGFLAITDYLLECGADIDRKTTDALWTPGHMAASNGQVACLKRLLDRGIDLHAGAGPDHRSTLLHEACYEGHLDCVKILLESGADATLTDAQKELPLHLVARRGYDKCLECLIEWYENHGIADKINAYPALDCAIDEKEFEKYPYDVKKALNNPLHLAAAYGHKRCVEILLERGAKHLTNGLGLYPIVLATIRQNVECIRAMLAYDPDIVKKSIGRDGFNPLHYLCMKTRSYSKKAMACACLLVNAGVDINDAPEEDPLLCPLGLAARSGSKELVQYVLSNGASPYSALNFTERAVRNMGFCATIIQHVQSHARPLIQIARIAIRKHLGDGRLADTFTLPLPLMFQNFIFHGHPPTDGLCDPVIPHVS